jgi:hypothetical protein
MTKVKLFCLLSCLIPVGNVFAVSLEELKKAGEDALETTKSKAGEIYESGKKKSGELLDDGKEATDELYNKAKNAIKKERTSRDNRKDSFLTLNWSPLVLASFPLPKSGFQAGWVASESVTIDPEYLSGGIGFSVAKLDIGKISDTLITLPVRYFPGNSFNTKVGGTYRKLSVVIGDSILSRIINRPAHLDLLEYKFYSLNVGLGNRWQLNNGITLGADWIDLNVPLSAQKNETITSYITDETDKKNVKTAINILTAVQFTALKFQIGYTF